MSELCYRAVPEETLYIDLPDTDGLKIKGILRGGLTQPVVVMMHGRPGSGNELLQYLGARYLYEQGFSSLRLFMYDFEPKTRNLLDCTLQTHADDFDAVIDYLREKNVPKLFALGHSYGGLTILKSKARLDAAVLWDPSHGLAWQMTAEERKLFPEKYVDGIVVVTSGAGFIMPEAMKNQDLKLGDTTNWAKGKGYPLKIISAPEGKLKSLGQKYAKVADAPKSYVEIAGAGHSFDESDEIMLQLFQETSSWFKEILGA